MKVRISGNSIRFRLKQSEVQVFKQEGKISQITEFGFDDEDKLAFTLLATKGNQFAVSKSSNTITLEVPKTVGEEWATTNLVGFEEKIDTGKGKVITVLVEKDFKCIDGTDKENEDSYPNPNVVC